MSYNPPLADGGPGCTTARVNQPRSGCCGVGLQGGGQGRAALLGPPVLTEDLFQCGQQRHHVFMPRGFAHQSDAPHPAGERAEPAADLNAEFGQQRSEEHTSELQSLAYLVCRLLLEKKKNEVPPCVAPNGCDAAVCPVQRSAVAPIGTA